MSGLTDVLKSVAPGIATALGGPLAGMAAGWLASKLGVPPEQVQQTLAGMTADQLVKMKEMDLDFQKFMADNNIKLDLAQIEVNKQEASSLNLFVAGWRPAVGWICGAGLAYATILEPLGRFVAQVGFHYTGPFPALDTALLVTTLGGILGLGTMRMNEKIKGVAGNH